MESSESPENEKLERLRTELREKAKSDPDFALQLEAMEHVIEEYGETLKRLADC